MFKKYFFLFCALCLLTTTACSDSSSTNFHPEHKIDENDIIFGSKKAPHEMIIYMSPGCFHCLSLFDLTNKIIMGKYVGDEKLRVVFREIPGIVPFVKDPDGGTKLFEQAQSNSFLLGLGMRCGAEYINDDAYVQTMYDITNSIKENVPAPQWKAWPHYKEEVVKKIFFSIGQKGKLTKEQYTSCITNPKKEEFFNIVNRNTEIFTKELGLSSLPTYYLDGEKLTLNGKYPAEDLNKKLKEKIGE